MVRKISRKEIFKFFKRNKEGILIGGIIGFIIGKFFLEGFVDLNIIASNTNSFLDVLNTAKSGTIELARTKIIWASSIFGAMIGAFVDESLPEGWLLGRLLR